MKSRVIQDGPPEQPPPSAHHNPMEICEKQMQRAMNIAGRMGSWSARHWKTAVFGWLACVIVFFAFGNTVIGFKQIDINDAGVGQSHKADQILKKAFPERRPQTEFVLVQSAKLTAFDPAFRSTVTDVIDSVKSSPAIKSLDSPYDPKHASLISDDRHTALVQWEMKGDADEAQDHIDALSAASDKVGDRHPAFFVGHAGVSSDKGLDQMFADQLKLAGERSIPITIGVLLIVLGTLVAVVIPVLLDL
jgi:RND superfamily putative drug exporter